MVFGMSGRLVYVIGPSGSGKDSVLDYARTRLPAGSEVIFARRFITREPQPDGEQHIPLSTSAFERILAHGGFALHWTANGLRYGISREISLWMSLDFHVAVNGSREYLPTVLQLFPDALVVHITAPPETIRLRLIGRGRESEAGVEARLQRAAALALPCGDDVLTIINDGTLAQAGEQLLQALASLRPADGR